MELSDQKEHKEERSFVEANKPNLHVKNYWEKMKLSSILGVIERARNGIQTKIKTFTSSNSSSISFSQGLTANGKEEIGEGIGES